MNVIQAIEVFATQTKNGYAQVYAVAAERDWTQWDYNTQKVQCLYILSNASHLRGADIKEARQVLKEFVK